MNKSFWRVTLLAGLLCSSLLACTRSPAGDSERVALEAAIDRWVKAVNTQDVATLAATLTRDVELLDANAAPVTGRKAAIQALCEAAVRGQLAGTTREITIANDVAWRVVALTQAQKNGDIHARGQALEIWKRVQGEWQLHRQMSAGVIAPADLLTRPSTKEPVLDQPKN